MGNFSFFFTVLIFFKINFLEKFFQDYNQSVNNLDPDKTQHFVGPDLGPNCLQRISAEDTSRKRIKSKMYIRPLEE